ASIGPRRFSGADAPPAGFFLEARSETARHSTHGHPPDSGGCMFAGERRKPLRRAALLFPLLAGLAASPARAAGGRIDLSWVGCGAFGASQKTFACSGGSQRLVLVGSAIAGVSLPKLVGQYSILELQSNASTLSPWWQLSAGGCRGASPSLIHADFDFTSGTGCVDPWSGGAIGGVDYEAGYGGGHQARPPTRWRIPGSTSISATEEYAFFKIAISAARSEACGGCADGACIVLESIELDQVRETGDYTLTTPILRNSVQWQSGSSSGTSSACAGALV